jgi:transposase-like protein
MNYQEVFQLVQSLSHAEQFQLIVSISQTIQQDQSPNLRSRNDSLINKQGKCPHCEGANYYRYGTAKGAQRFKCKSCGRTFCEYTGTWLEGIHKKALIEPYLGLMINQHSLEKTSKKIGINKKTAFDWRHKILSSIEQNTGDQFEGIVESDETFFEHSEKGDRDLKRPARNRGTEVKKSGIGTNKATVIVSTDRKKSMKMTVSTMGRISKADIKESFQNPLPETSTLCSDGHVSYKGYSIDNNLNHVVLRSDLKQHVKNGVYHIQHVNEIHNRLKKWLDSTFWGVSTKYLQSYLNWFFLCEKLKNEAMTVDKVVLESVQNTHAIKQYRYIDISYEMLKATLF